MLTLIVFADGEALVEDVDFATVYEVEVVTILVLADDDVIRHEEDSFEVVDNEALFNGRAIFELNHVFDEVLILVEQYLISQ